jgi:hypothetical protein
MENGQMEIGLENQLDSEKQMEKKRDPRKAVAKEMRRVWKKENGKGYR